MTLILLTKKYTMLFNSLHFAAFLPIVFILYWILPHRFRWALLLLSSYYFYMSWNPRYVFLILATTIVSYWCARLLEKADSIKQKRAYLLIALLVCFGLLFFFKYFNFVSENVAALLNRFSLPVHAVTLKLLLPVGISFYTFQTLSYVIDVYRGDVPAERHFGVYATFISFFPQLVAGPIERTSNLLPQIRERHFFDYAQASYGMKLMLWGYLKKIVIADTLAQYVDAVFGNLPAYSGFALVIAAGFFTLQIYCDFSGYSDIAIGCAKLFGINLMTNFKSPYFSTSIKEFWSRWHISLSTWFRDYVYIPLGGNRCSKARQRFNLIVTFLVSGLWHGANWTFIVWGAIHGVAQAIEHALKKTLEHIRNAKVGAVFLTLAVFIFCNIAWILFRAQSLSDAAYIFTNMFSGIEGPIAYLKAGFVDLGIDKLRFVYLAVLIIILAVYDFFNRKGDIIEKLNKTHSIWRWLIYMVMALIVVFFSQKGVAAEFIYFQF